MKAIQNTVPGGHSNPGHGSPIVKRSPRFDGRRNSSIDYTICNRAGEGGMHQSLWQAQRRCSQGARLTAFKLPFLLVTGQLPFLKIISDLEDAHQSAIFEV
jgi:hypothetical protein